MERIESHKNKLYENFRLKQLFQILLPLQRILCSTYLFRENIQFCNCTLYVGVGIYLKYTKQSSRGSWGELVSFFFGEFLGWQKKFNYHLSSLKYLANFELSLRRK